MATAKIEIKGGTIVNHNGVYFHGSSEDGTEISINGWDVRIEGGRIICHAERVYSDGPHRYHKEFPLQDGTVGLAGGNIDDRYAYFRGEAFQAFLAKYGITAVKRENPNQEFSGFVNHSGWGDAEFSVVSDGTDGTYFEADEAFERMINRPGNNPNLWSGTAESRVTGATWALVKTKVDYRDKHNSAAILYTLVKDITSLATSLDAHLVKA